MMASLLYKSKAEAWTLTSSDEQALGVFERKIVRKIYGPFCGRSEWHLRWNQELQDKYDVIDVVKSSNLSQVVEVAEKDGLASVGPTR